MHMQLEQHHTPVAEETVAQVQVTGEQKYDAQGERRRRHWLFRQSLWLWSGVSLNKVVAVLDDMFGLHALQFDIHMGSNKRCVLDSRTAVERH